MPQRVPDEAVLGPPKTKDKVLIVGAANTPPKYKAAPLHLAAEYEVWTMNDLGARYEHSTWDRYFELHTYGQFSEHTDPEYRRAMLGDIATEGAVVYLAEEMHGVQPWLEFPFNELRVRWPRGDYHCSSFDWLLVLAMELGFKEIRFSGMGDMGVEANEPRSARACLEYWIGVAEGEGLRVDVNEGANVLRNIERDGGMYPMDPPTALYAWDSEIRQHYRTVHDMAHDMAKDAMEKWLDDPAYLTELTAKVVALRGEADE